MYIIIREQKAQQVGGKLQILIGSSSIQFIITFMNSTKVQRHGNAGRQAVALCYAIHDEKQDVCATETKVINNKVLLQRATNH